MAVVGGFSWLAVQHSEKPSRRSEYEDRRQALLSDPFVLQVLADNRQKCADQDVYVWAGGVTLRFKRPPGYSRCSTPNTPWFAGTLSVSTGSDEFRQWTWPQVSTLFLSDDENCRAETCATLSILGGPESAYFIPALRYGPPVSVPDEPAWPDFESVLTYGSWQEGAWAKFQGATVRFFFGQGELGDLKGYRPPISMFLQHPRYPVLMAVVLPPDQRETWRVSLQAAFSLIENGVVSVSTPEDGPAPPPSVRFLAGEFDGSLDFLKAWQNLRMVD